MAFREVDVIEVREVLRAWLSGKGQRRVARQAGVDRKTAVRYVDAAVEAGLDRSPLDAVAAPLHRGAEPSVAPPRPRSPLPRP